MSNHHSSATASVKSSGASGNLAAAVILINLLIVGAVWLSQTAPSGTSQPQTSGLSVAYVQTQASIPLPTDTPLPSLTPAGAVRRRAFAPEPQRIRAGERTFQTVCSTCHGFSAQGMPGLGPSMIDNTFINGQSNTELLAFIIHGRDASAPDNKSGVAMPARGGNPSLTDQDLTNVIHYIRSLNPTVVVYDEPAGDGAPAQPAAVEVVAVTPTPFVTVAAVEFKPVDLSGLGALAGGGASATETPAP